MDRRREPEFIRDKDSFLLSLRKFLQKDGLILTSYQDIISHSGEFPGFKHVPNPNHFKGTERKFLFEATESATLIYLLKNGKRIKREIKKGDKHNGASVPERLRDRIDVEAFIPASSLHDKDFNTTEKTWLVQEKLGEPWVRTKFTKEDSNILYAYNGLIFASYTDCLLSIMGLTVFSGFHYKEGGE